MSRRILGLAALLVTALLSLLAAGWHGAFVLAAATAFSPAFDLAFATGDLARPFLVLIAVVTPGVALWTFKRGFPSDGLRLAPFAIFMTLLLLAQSVAAFALCWELMALASAFLVGTHHARGQVRGALFSYVFVSQLGAACLIAALAMLGAHAGSYHFAAIARDAPQLPDGLRNAVIALSLLGFGSKAGLLPLHFWLPRAHPAAPANASALLSGVMLNVAIYGLLVVSLRLAAPVSAAWGAAFVGIGLATGLFGALFAALEPELKRLLAFSSLENSGILVAALGVAIVAAAAGAPLVAGLAIAALLFHALSHGFFKSLLFLGAGTIYDATGTTELDRLGGLARWMPLTASCVLIGCLAAAALPPAAGFASEWLLFQSFIHGIAGGATILRIVCAIAIAGLAAIGGLTAVAFVKFFGIGFLGLRRSARKTTAERGGTSFAGLIWLAAATLGLGLFPNVAYVPLVRLRGLDAAATGAFALPVLPLALVILPFAGAALALALARVRGIRTVPTWACGSDGDRRSQYTAAAFSNPLGKTLDFVLAPMRARDHARSAAAIMQRFSRRARIVQSGLLRVYLVYAAAAVIVILVIAR